MLIWLMLWNGLGLGVMLLLVKYSTLFQFYLYMSEGIVQLYWEALLLTLLLRVKKETRHKSHICD